ncbi:MAG: serine/threonine protein kinase [Halorhabdus sp.]
MEVDYGAPGTDGRHPGEPDPAAVRSLVLPPVLDGLAGDDRRARISAAWTACRLAEERPDLAAELADSLVRAADRTPQEPLVRTLASLHDRHPEPVGDVLRTFEASVVRAVRHASGWDFDAELRADGGAMAASQRVVDTGEAGVTVYQRQLTSASASRHAEPAGRDGPGQDSAEPDAATRDTDTTPGDDSTPDADASAVDSPHADDHERADAVDEPDSPATAVRRRRRIQAAENSESFAAVQLVSDFESVTVVEPPRRGRYGHVLPSRARVDQAEYGVDVVFFDEPDADAETFDAAVGEQLAHWQAADEAPGIAAVADYGEHSRPWVAVPRVTQTLADRSRTDLDRAVRDARELAAGLTAAHERGLVHGGIDPYDVVYPATGFASDPTPSLAHFGVVSVFRDAFGPTGYVDPRYAAPEYFDDSYGQIDHATDVYHLGAVLYRLVTGTPPFEGDYETVRSSVLADDVPRPTDARSELPAAVDEIIAKAMAPRKLTRYEEATRLLREIEYLE